MRILTDTAKIDGLLTRGVEDIHVRESLEEKLRLKLGIDPTGPDLRIGQAVAL